MNKLIIREVVERDVTPTSFPMYRKDKTSDIFYAIMPDYIIKVFLGYASAYTALSQGSYDALGRQAMDESTIESDYVQFAIACQKALELLQNSTNECATKNWDNIINEGNGE